MLEYWLSTFETEEYMDSFLNTSFPKIVEDKTNAEVMAGLVGSVYFREVVVKHLERIENEDLGHFWWEDKVLMSFFEELFKAGVLLLPSDPVDRIRWIALACVEASNMEDFSCGNIIIPFDFLPVDMFEIFEADFGTKIMDAVIEFRESLAKKGWKVVFGW